MAYRLFRQLFRLLVLMSLLSNAAACPVSNLTVGIFEMPPFYGHDQQGKPAGELIELMNEVQRLTDCRWTARYHENTPRLLENLVDGDVDLGMVIRHPLLEGKVIYGDVPVGSLRLEAYHLPDKPDLQQIDQLKNHRVIVIRGYGYGGLIKRFMDPQSGIHLLPAKDHNQAFDWLTEGRGEYLLDYYRPGTRTLQAKGLYHLGSSTLQDKDIFFVLSPRVANPDQILHELQGAVLKIQQLRTAAK